MVTTFDRAYRLLDGPERKAFGLDLKLRVARRPIEVKLVGSISKSYALRCYGSGEAGPVIGAGGEADEVEPTQVVVQIAGGDAAAGTQEVLQPTVAAVDRLHMQIAPNPFPIERLSVSWLTLSAAAQGG